MISWLHLKWVSKHIALKVLSKWTDYLLKNKLRQLNSYKLQWIYSLFSSDVNLSVLRQWICSNV